MPESMLIAKPAPEGKIRELAEDLAHHHSGISVESFLLPRNESCNLQWNMISTRNYSVLLNWFAAVMIPETRNSDSVFKQREQLLEDMLSNILGNEQYLVVVDNNRVPLTFAYLLETDNWISHVAGLAIEQTIVKHLGDHFNDIEVVTGPNNPWLEPAIYLFKQPVKGFGIIQEIAQLSGGPRQVYKDVAVASAFFNRNTLYEIIDDFPIGSRKRRMSCKVHWTNLFYVEPTIMGWHHAILSYVPVLFSQHPLLKKIPGFNLQPADVRFEFPDDDCRNTWGVTIDYDITPIDRLRSYFYVGELQETVSTLSAQVLELQRDRKALSEEAERLAEQLVEEEKARRIYQVRAAQADAVARFLHQTSNLVLQPLASTMIVFEDFIEIIEDCRTEWALDKSEEELYQELDESLRRIQEVYPTAQQVINGYRALFHAFYEIYVSTKPERDVNQDLRYIETLVQNKYILTQVALTLELDPAVLPLKLEGGVQSIFLELMHNAARHGARRILVRSEFDEDAGQVRLSFYNDGEPIPEEKWEVALEHEVTREGRGFGLADARYIVETLNNGHLRLIKPDRQGFSVLFIIDFKIAAQETT